MHTFPYFTPLILTLIQTRTVDIERTDSGVGSESSQASSGRGGAVRRWRAGNGNNSTNNTSNHGSQSRANGNHNSAITTSGVLVCATLPAASKHPATDQAKHCEDCEQRLEPFVIDR